MPDYDFDGKVALVTGAGRASRPIGRIADADEIAEAVLWLASPAASFVVGIGMPVDGGYTIP